MSFGQHQPGYQRPPSTTGFGAPPAPPAYGTTQAYQTGPPQPQSQWAPPAPSQTPSQQWNQQPPPGGYNSSGYGYTQAQQAHVPNPADIPPPPPPKPAGFAAAVAQQNAQSWAQQPPYGTQTQHGLQETQPHSGYAAQGQYSRYDQQGGYQTQGPAQQYNSAPPPHTQAHSGSYYAPSQTPQAGGYSASTYGSGAAGSYSTPSSAVAQYPPPSVLNANGPPLTGQPIPPYAPTNTNPAPGVYVPPPPDVSTWQQASAPQSSQGQLQHNTPGQHPVPVPHPSQNPTAQGQQAPAYGQPLAYNATPQSYQQHPNQWQANPPGDGHGQQPATQAPPYAAQQQAAQPGYQAHSALPGQQYPGPDQGLPAPRPLNGHIGTTPSFVNEPSPKIARVSPVHNRHSSTFSSNQHGSGRPDSVSSIALGAVHAQHPGGKVEIPSSFQTATAAPHGDDSKFSALGSGGPSDWEHFGGGDEVDDEELFGVKKENHNQEPVQPGTAELPSQDPPAPQNDWPTPSTKPASLYDRDSYQPTPPPTHQAPPHPQQAYPAGNVPTSQEPQQSFHRDSVPPATPPHPLSQPQSTQENIAAVNQASSSSHHAELKAKDEAIERLRTESEKEKSDLRDEIEQLKVVLETTKTHAQYERRVMDEQMESTKTAAEQAKKDADTFAREKESMIARLKEDIEGKDDAVKEKDVLIGDLRKQLSLKESEISIATQQLEAVRGELKAATQQLEAEKSKEPPVPKPADLISDIDPWYAGSLERFIAMLRSEAHESLVENKIKVFTDFLRAESGARGLEYYTAPPPAPTMQQTASSDTDQHSATPHRASLASLGNMGLNVQVPMDSASDDIQYSPGGRPIVQPRDVLKREDNAPYEKGFSAFDAPSSQSTTVLTPTSSQDDDYNKTPTPMQSPPKHQPALQYKAYVPPSIPQTDGLPGVHRQSLSSVNPPLAGIGSSFGHSKKDEIFFGPPKPSSRPTTSASAGSDVSIPAPLFTPQPPAALLRPAPSNSDDAIEKLTKLLPVTVQVPKPNSQLEEIEKKLATIVDSDPFDIENLTATWEKNAAAIRKKNNDERRKRQEQSEEHTDQLFNDHEIAYADIGIIEEEFKEKERILKAEEDREEYKSYVEAVFDKVYDGLQLQIRDLMDMYIETETLMDISVSGIKTFEGTDAPVTEPCLHTFKGIFELVEERHDRVAQAVAERDKRYKKTEIQPLYAAGNIAKMKSVEKHFANAEKQAVRRERAEKAGRFRVYMEAVEHAVMAAVGVARQEIQSILAAMRDVPPTVDEKLLKRASETILALQDSCSSLLLINSTETDAPRSLLEAELADAKAEKDADRVAELEKEIESWNKELVDKSERQSRDLEQEREVLDALMREKVGQKAEKKVQKAEQPVKVELTEEEEKKARIAKALEAAKRRNGDL